MKSKTAREYIVNNEARGLSIPAAIAACEIAEQEMKQRAISAFSKFVEDYCYESGRKDINANSDHYIRVFKSLID